MQHLLGTSLPGRNPDPYTWCFGSLYHAKDELRSPHWHLQWLGTWKELGHRHMLVGREYKEVWPFLLFLKNIYLFFMFVVGGFVFFYWIQTYNLSLPYEGTPRDNM